MVIVNKLMIFLFTCQLLFSSSVIAKKHITIKQQQYLKARKQYLLEYTTFGVDECLKLYNNKITTKKNESGKILVGSPEYFRMLSMCFHKITNKCYGENCIVSRSMSKRLENVNHVDSILKSL